MSNTQNQIAYHRSLERMDAWEARTNEKQETTYNAAKEKSDQYPDDADLKSDTEDAARKWLQTSKTVLQDFVSEWQQLINKIDTSVAPEAGDAAVRANAVAQLVETRSQLATVNRTAEELGLTLDEDGDSN